MKAQNALQSLDSLLNSFAMKGSESASSCSQILRMLGPANLRLPTPTNGVENDLWDLFASASGPSQPLDMAINLPTFAADAPVDDGLPSAFNETLGKGIVNAAEWEDLWKSIGISWDQ